MDYLENLKIGAKTPLDVRNTIPYYTREAKIITNKSFPSY